MTDPAERTERTGEPRPDRAELRETLRQQTIASIGGWQGALIAAIPTLVFVVVNAFASLTVAVVSAVGSALLLAGYRMVRRQSVQQALSGLFGVLVAAIIAARTGEARGYFLFGIWTSLAYAVPFAISVIVRRPLVGLIWEFLDPTPAPDGTPWHRRRPLLLAYTWATLAATLVFLARWFVQWQLYGEKRTGWLAFARLAMGYPLFVAVVGFSFVIVTRARKRVVHGADPTADRTPDPATDHSPDRTAD